MDRRQKKTRAAIFRAFTALLKEQSFSKITVQQIIDLADVGRTTFYAHFETKDALLRSLCEDIFEHVFSGSLNREKTHDFSHETDTRAKVTHILYHLQEHLSYLPGMLSGESGEVFTGPLKARLKELFAPLVPEGMSAPRDYLLERAVCGFADTVRWWSYNRQYTPEEVSAFFFETSPALR